jgi:hypothetical protein
MRFLTFEDRRWWNEVPYMICAGHGSIKFHLSTERLEYAVLIPSWASSYEKRLFLSWELDSSAFYMSSGLFNMPSSSIVSHRKKSIQKSLVNFGCCNEPIEDLLHFSLLDLDLLCELFQPIKTRNFLWTWKLYFIPLAYTKQKASFLSSSKLFPNPHVDNFRTLYTIIYSLSLKSTRCTLYSLTSCPNTLLLILKKKTKQSEELRSMSLNPSVVNCIFLQFATI